MITGPPKSSTKHYRQAASYCKYLSSVAAPFFVLRLLKVKYWYAELILLYNIYIENSVVMVLKTFEGSSQVTRLCVVRELPGA